MKLVKSVPVNYRRVWCITSAVSLCLWILPFILGKYTDVTFPFIASEDIPQELVGLVGPTENGLDWCPVLSPHVVNVDRLTTNKIFPQTDEDIVKKYNILPGGTWKPTECQSRYHVAIIIPYRNRSLHLQQFLTYMHPFLMRQQLNYRIVVVEQTDEKQFNRAKLLNIGFVETNKLAQVDCFIFHDVDLLPQNDLNVYACTHNPRHMYSAIDTFRYQLPYRRLFGGAVAVQKVHFEEINGFANNFYGWGAEDDDFYNRFEKRGLHIIRFDPAVAKYVMLSHVKATPSKERYAHLWAESTRNDGLSDLTYKLLKKELRSLYTWLYVSC